MTPDVQGLIDLVQQFGIWIIFAWLYITEKRDHAETRRRTEQELKEARQSHMNDIREIAGMRQALYQVGSAQHPAVPRDSRDIASVQPSVTTPV